MLIRSGYVLDFSTNDFNVFALRSVGVTLCDKYQLSKGISLTTYLNEANESENQKLLLDLLEHYEAYFDQEVNCDLTNPVLDGYRKREIKRYHQLYLKCRQVADRLSSHQTTTTLKGNDLKKKFSSEYVTSQIDIMVKMQTENPTEAIGKAKELIESCCKTILEECSTSFNSK